MNWSGSGRCSFALKNMCSYMCASPAYSGVCVNEPFFTSIFHGRERHAVILDDDDLEPVRQHTSLDDLVQLGSLPAGRRGRQSHEQAASARGATHARVGSMSE